MVYALIDNYHVNRDIRSLQYWDQRRTVALQRLTARRPRQILGVLVRMLRKNSNPAVRSGVVEALGVLCHKHSLQTANAFVLKASGYPQAFAALRQALNDPVESVRLEAVTALGRIGDTQSIPLLSKLINTPHKGLRQRVLVALSELGDQQALPLLMNALKDEDGLIRKSAVEALSRLHDDHKRDLLLGMLDDPQLDIRLLAANALDQIAWRPQTTYEQIAYAIAKGKWDSPLLSEPEAVESLLRVLTEDRPENVNARVNAAIVLGKIGEQRAVAPLMHMAATAQGDTLATVLTALGDLKDDRALDLLIRALKDRNSTIRLAAANALGNFQAKHAIDALIQALGDTNPAVQGDRNPEVQRAAAAALGKIGGERVMTALIHALEDDDGIVRFEAAEVLTQSGWTPRNVTEQIHAYIARGKWTALIEFGAQALPALINRAKDKDRTIREQVAEVLGELLGVVKVVVFGNVQVKEARKKVTLCNPEVVELAVPMRQLEHIVIHTPTHNFYQVEQFLTYAINHLGQEYLKKQVTVHIYGDPAQLHQNLRNSFQNLCKAVEVHQQASRRP